MTAQALSAQRLTFNIQLERTVVGSRRSRLDRKQVGGIVGDPIIVACVKAALAGPLSQAFPDPTGDDVDDVALNVSVHVQRSTSTSTQLST